MQQGVGLAVERPRGFHQNQHRRIFQQRPRNRQALALAPGKPHAALSNYSIVPGGKRDNEIVGQSGAGRGLDFFLGNVRLSVGNVVADGVVEEYGFLRDDADLSPKRG